MAWFNRTNSEDTSVEVEDQVLPLTFERVAQVMTAKDWHFETKEGHYYAFFDGFATVIEPHEEGTLLSVYSWSTGAFDSQERFPEALAWANAWNENTLFGTARPFIDNDGDVMMRIDTVHFSKAGVTDEQLELMLDVSIDVNVAAIKKYTEDLGLEIRTSPEE